MSQRTTRATIAKELARKLKAQRKRERKEQRRKEKAAVAHTEDNAELRQMTPAEAQSFVSEPLTEFQGHSERCSNPFCEAPMTAKSKHAPVKLSCSNRCRMDR
jgi:hypothetical protein